MILSPYILVQPYKYKNLGHYFRIRFSDGSMCLTSLLMACQCDTLTHNFYWQVLPYFMDLSNLYTYCIKCRFCNNNETIRHIFFECHHAKEIWRIVYLPTGLHPPNSVSHMLGNWLSLVDKKGTLNSGAGCSIMLGYLETL